MRHIIPISGKDSLATALTQISKEHNIDYEFMFRRAEENGCTENFFRDTLSWFKGLKAANE